MMEKIKNFLNRQPGYKVVDSHFKLGSKIHISDFYYAKRMFQNSFFASRYALITAEYILNTNRELFKGENNPKEITLVGYGHYSALLLSLIEYLLLKKKPKSTVNHGIIKDYETVEFVDKIDIKENIIIIVPIASTFSTSIKIYEKLINENKNLAFNSADINILFVSNGIDDISDDIREKYRSFGILLNENTKTSKELEVEILSNKDQGKRKQKFFTELQTFWNINKNCTKCGFDIDGSYNDSLIEYPLYNTDESSVTPSMIFNYPNARALDNLNRQKYPVIKKEYIDYGHIEQYNNRVNISLNVEKLFADNVESVKEWLVNISNEFVKDKNVLIIAAGHPSNTQFVNMVNRIIFNSSANILHFNPEIEQLQNFDLIYRGLIKNSDVIYFIDTELTTGLCFQRINYYLKAILDTLNGRGVIKEGFNSSLFLLNRSSHYNYEHVKRSQAKNAKIYSWIDLHLPVVKPFNHRTVLEIEYDFVQTIYKEIHIQRLKDVYYKSCVKLKPRDAFFEIKNSDKHETLKKQNRAFYKTVANHILFNFFNDKINQDLWRKYTNVNDFIKSILEKNTEKDEEGGPSHFKIIKNVFGIEVNDVNKVDLKFAIIKSLCYSPLKNYKSIADKMLPWLKVEFCSILEELKDKEKLEEGDYGILKFYVKRLVLLDCNFVISKSFFNVLKPILNSSKNNASECKELIAFLAGQIKYLITKNLSKSVNLEKLLFEEYSKLNVNCHYSQLIRILVYENSTNIKISLEYLINSSNDNNLGLFPIDFNDLNNYKITQLKDFFDSSQNSLTYNNLNSFLELFILLTKENATQNNDLLKSNNNLDYPIPSNLSIKQKIESICKKILKILPNLIDNHKPEIFLFVLNNSLIDKKSFYVPYNSANIKEDNECFASIYKILLLNQPSPNPLHNHTIIEFAFKDNKWVDIQSVNDNIQKLEVKSDFLSKDFDRIVFIKISSNNGYEDHSKHFAKGVIGICYKADKENRGLLNPFISRYLLWLSKPLSSFIEHHMENDEFRELYELENKQKDAKLAGHSKEMLISISKRPFNYDSNKETNKNKYSDIVLTQEHLKLIIETENINKKLYPDKAKLVSSRFNHFYKIKEEKISKDYFYVTNYMFKDILEMDDIEIKLERMIEGDTGHYFLMRTLDEEIDFSFSKNILDVILFELMVNAKKNRYIFLSQINNILYSESAKYLVCDFGNISVTNMNKNYFSIQYKIENRQLKVGVFNTCVFSNIANELNNNIIKSENISGTSFISKLLDLFELGKIEYFETPIHQASNLAIFSAILTLNSNNK